MLEDTVKMLNLKETEYFGFRFIDADKQSVNNILKNINKLDYYKK